MFLHARLQFIVLKYILKELSLENINEEQWYILLFNLYGQKGTNIYVLNGEK